MLISTEITEIIKFQLTRSPGSDGVRGWTIAFLAFPDRELSIANKNKIQKHCLNKFIWYWKNIFLKITSKIDFHWNFNWNNRNSHLNWNIWNSKHSLLQYQITLSKKCFWILFLFAIESSRSGNAKNAIVHPLRTSQLKFENFGYFTYNFDARINWNFNENRFICEIKSFFKNIHYFYIK